VLEGTLTDGSPYRYKLTSRTRDVTIDEPALATIDLAPLAKIALRKLYIRARSLTQLDTAPLAASSIEELQLVVPGATFSLPTAKLKRLSICGGPTTIDFTPIATAALTELMYFDTPLEVADLGPLARCKALSIMWLSQCALRALDLRPLAKLPALCALELSRSRLETVDMGSAGFATLTHLHLHHNPLHRLTMGKLPALRVLNLPATVQVDIAPRKGLEIKVHGSK
jgi:hypothetical protein